uniref:hypothetical protein n=1 Tax=Halococcus sp. PRR34 TaxID=3020830 RepID=UPI00235E8093
PTLLMESGFRPDRSVWRFDFERATGYPTMNRNHLVLILVALFTISVIAVAASSINSANIESGFGIEGGSDELGNASPPNASSEKAGDAGGSGNSGFISEILSWELSVNSDSAASPNSGISGVIIAVLLGLVAGSIGLIFWATSDDTALSTTPESPVSEHTPDGTESGTGNSSTVASCPLWLNSPIADTL